MTERNPSTGKFAKGNQASVGHGSRPRNVKDSLLQRLLDTTDGSWDAITLAMVKQAKKGNVQAARYLAEYAVGKPPQILELRAGEAAMLKEILQRFEANGVPASDVFNAMLATFAESELESVDSDDEYE